MIQDETSVRIFKVQSIVSQDKLKSSGKNAGEGFQGEMGFSGRKGGGKE